MTINSPIYRLVDTLEQVRSAAQQYVGKLKNNEAMTRAVLIDPVIRSLGWDTGNPDMVEFERVYKSTILDYAMNDCKGEVRVIVEAKALGVNLTNDKIFTSIMAYGLTYKIPSIFLTDGIIWKHYRLAEFSKLEPVVMDFRNDSLVDCALYLIENLDAAHYWAVEKPTITKKEIVTFKVTAPSMIQQAQSAEQDVNGTVLPSNGDFISLSSLVKDLTNKKSPSSIRLPDGSVKSLKSWRDILYLSILFVLANTPDLPMPVPDKAGKKGILIDYQRMNLKGAIIKENYLGKEVFIYLNYDTNHIISNAQYILSFLPPEVSKYPVAVKF